LPAVNLCSVPTAQAPVVGSFAAETALFSFKRHYCPSQIFVSMFVGVNDVCLIYREIM